MERVVLEYKGVRVDLTHVHPATRRPIVSEAEAWIASGQRLPLLTIHRDGVDVSTRPDLWPARVREYRGLGRYEWVGDAE